MAVSAVLGSVTTLMMKVLSRVFGAESWRTWRTLLSAIFSGLDGLEDEERALVAQLTGRSRLPARPRELWFILGRRSGKTIIAALFAIFATCCCTYTLAPGEVGVFILVAADRRQARVAKRYISGLLRSVSVLETLIARETADTIWLKNGLCIEIHTCSYRSLRGYTCVGAICDEICFWDDADSANPDHEVLVALRAAMATVPEALLIALSSPYARRGEAWKVYEKHWANNDSDRVLVVNAATRVLNPTVDQSVIDDAYADDPNAAAAEFGAEWRQDVEVFLPSEALQAVRMPDRFEVAFQSLHRGGYVCVFDAAGGTGADSMTAGVAHSENGRVILDAVREARPPFSPEGIVKEFADLFKAYGVTTAVADRYAGSWPTEAFRKVGITVTPSERTRSEIYLAALPMIMSGQVEILDNPRLLKQLASLERRKGRQGKDSVDAPPRQHEDLANSACLALVEAGLRKAVQEPTTMRLEGW